MCSQLNESFASSLNYWNIQLYVLEYFCLVPFHALHRNDETWECTVDGVIAPLMEASCHSIYGLRGSP